MQYPIHNKIHFSLERAIDDAETEKTATPIDKYHIPHSICVVADRQRAQRIETRVVRNLLKISKSNAKCQISNWLSHFWCFVPEKWTCVYKHVIIFWEFIARTVMDRYSSLLYTQIAQCVSKPQSNYLLMEMLISQITAGTQSIETIFWITQKEHLACASK